MTIDPRAATETDLGEVGLRVIASLNEGFGDAMLFVGRVLGRRPRATAARAVAIDRCGIELAVVDPDGTHRVRLDFPHVVEHDVQLTGETFALVRRARELSGEHGETSAEREMRRRMAIRTHLTHVSTVADVHPRLRRITFQGGDLESFSPIGPDTFLYVLLPPPGRDELTIDRSFTWQQHARMPEEERPVGAYYTVRAWRPEAAQLDMLCVLHEPAGPASEWAARATPGDPVGLWGPRTAWDPPDGTDWYLLVADDTGLPAVAVILEQLPADAPVLVVAEVDGAAERQDLPDRPGTDARWVHREGRAPGTVTDDVLAVVRGLQVPPGAGYVWGGGESRTMTAVRRHVRDELGMARDQVSLVAYWRRGENRPGEEE